jgi:hypothetical protein
MRRLLVPVIAMIVAGTQPAMAGDVKTDDALPELANIENGPTTLNDHVVVDTRVVRLGDLFTNAGDKAEVSVAYAPAPGERSVLDARWLYRVAHAYKLDWRPLSAMTQAVVERSSITIPLEEVKSQILFALADQGVTEEMDVEFASRFGEIHLPAGAVPTVSVENMMYQERTGRFSGRHVRPGRQDTQARNPDRPPDPRQRCDAPAAGPEEQPGHDHSPCPQHDADGPGQGPAERRRWRRRADSERAFEPDRRGRGHRSGTGRRPDAVAATHNEPQLGKAGDEPKPPPEGTEK